MSGAWPMVSLGEICEIQRGGSPRPISSYTTESEDGINWIKIGDVAEGAKYLYSTEEKIRPEGVKRSRMVYPGDFILSNSMSFGRPYIMRTTGCIHDGWLVLRDTKKRLSEDYLYRVLGSDFVVSQFKKMAVGAVVKNLNKEVVQAVVIPLPPLPERERLDPLRNLVDFSVSYTAASSKKTPRTPASPDETQRYRPTTTRCRLGTVLAARA